jgi:hypothetical protein
LVSGLGSNGRWYTGQQYVGHSGCKHPVREHKFGGCARPGCTCRAARHHLVARPNWVRFGDWVLRIVGAIWLGLHLTDVVLWIAHGT